MKGALSKPKVRGGGFTKVQEKKMLERQEQGQLALNSIRFLIINIFVLGRWSLLAPKKRRAKK